MAKKTTVVNGRVEKCDIFIGRGSEWGNPYIIGVHGTRDQCIWLYRRDTENNPAKVAKIKRELKGQRLGCYCKPLPCHGDVLAEIADA